ncbi:hypothetical protein ABEB36_014184 [Hypothenemus hampei]|uniref:Uncharacterized protein n=1 Tax=Hypothenemus hampei TaxID=57062 RepID=A0ABD1E858_HYPHA
MRIIDIFMLLRLFPRFSSYLDFICRKYLIFLVKVIETLIRRKICIKKRKVRRWWVRPINRRKRLKSDYYHLYKEMRAGDPDCFFNYTRMSIEMFDELLSLVKENLTKNSFRESISPECRLLITIR